MKLRILLAAQVALATGTLSSQDLLVDFNSTSQSGGPHPQAGYQAYNAAHEVPADFVTRSFPAFGTSIDITPAWPNTTDNRVQQMIDRGDGNDANWNNASSDLDLITDFLGIDTRPGNGGNGNWDGDAGGTPTYMTLTLGGLPAGTYGWTSFHHDTEHVHTNFEIELSLDGGTSYTSLGQEFYMSDSTPGGNPDSATDGAGGTRTGPDASTLNSTATFQIDANGTDDVVLRFAPLSGVLGSAVHNQIWAINGFQLSATDDADADGLADSFEQGIIAADPDDDIATLEDVLPGDDFDDDGSTNQEESDNMTDPSDDDSDDDGLLDGLESNTGNFVGPADTGSNPNNPDSDADGLSDGEEVSEDNGFVTDPTNADTDGDGFDDGNELAEGSNPTDPNDAPEVGLTILFLGNAAGPTAGADAAIMTFLQDSYGTQNVTYLQSSVAQPGDELGFGALLLSSTFGSGSARGKFQDSPVPILNWEEALARNAGGEFAVTDGRTKETASHSITINVEHPITAGFQAGQRVQMTTGAAEFWWSTGLQAPGAVSLASDDTSPTNGFLTIVEAGDELLTGQPAPGRRIMLGITDNTFNFFTDDARTLFAQSIDWLLGLSDDANRFQLTEVSHDPISSVLAISWESRAGKLYNLRSILDPGSATPLEWPVFGGNIDLVATPPENTLTIPLPDEQSRFFVVEEFNAPPVILFADDLESGAEGWTTVVNDATGNTRWELGSPSGSTGPLTGAGDSATAWSTNLGDYGPDSDISLRSPAFDLSGVASAELTFKAFRDADGFGDSAAVRFLRAADLLQLGAETAIDMTVFDTDYTSLSIPVVPEALGENVIIEWTFVSDVSADAFSGLTIDDIEVIE
ncbi:MAG: choice-of-anchor J domain-containing protein [Verrucomicrobiota bacterium]|nr:choice-of-anchor J domain-containing protein [Verrucomicrobiota bacterium]